MNLIQAFTTAADALGVLDKPDIKKAAEAICILYGVEGPRLPPSEFEQELLLLIDDAPLGHKAHLGLRRRVAALLSRSRVCALNRQPAEE